MFFLKNVSASVLVSESGEWRIAVNKQSEVMHRCKEKGELEPERVQPRYR